MCVCVMSVGLEEPGVIEQVDLTPTLALGLGLPISQNSVGRIIPGVFQESSLRDQLRFLHLNGHQLSCLLKDSMPDYQKGEARLRSEPRPQETLGWWKKRPLKWRCLCSFMAMNHTFVKNRQLVPFIRANSC